MTLILNCKPCEYTGISQPYKAGKHRGIDLVNHKTYNKTEIRAVADGVVVCAGGKGHNWDWSYGNEVAIYHGNGYYTNYGHLSKICVKVGQKVIGGNTILGYMGNSGRSTGIHLHFEVWDTQGQRRNFNKHRVNPKPYIDAAGTACKYEVITKTNNLIVRKNPKAGSDVIGTLQKGSIVIGTTRSGSWIYIPDRKGWSSKTFLKKV